MVCDYGDTNEWHICVEVKKGREAKRKKEKAAADGVLETGRFLSKDQLEGHFHILKPPARKLRNPCISLFIYFTDTT